MNWTSRLRSYVGMSLAEVSVVLSVGGVLASVAAPAIGDYIAEARYNKARQDTSVIASAFARFTGDVVEQSARDGGWATYQLLAGGGTVPALGSGGDGAWLASDEAGVGSLDTQLVTNTAGYGVGPWRQVNPRRGWHGPYVQAGIGPDPWGRRYAINVGGSGNILVLSAGPNGLVETAFNGNAIVPGGDDIAATVTSSR
ncbi:MAG: type II secretion system protein GspG [Acidobacteriota bacterium]